MTISKVDAISELLKSNNEAVERAMLRLSLQGTEETTRQYYVQWINRGKKLSRHHLTNARELALKYAADLAAISKEPSKRNGAPINPKCVLTMTREGSWQLATFGTSHCGIGDNILVKYKAVIKCSPKTDDRGFLFDQINVDKFFQNVKRTSLSCEMLAIQCTEKLAAALVKENPTVEIKELELTLSPAPHAASMTYSWKA